MSKPCPVISHYLGEDQQKLASRVWQCDNALADVICLHGIVSHGGWYQSSCSHLAANGFQVHFLERRGSGLNQADRGDVAAWTQWVSDVRVYLEQLPTDRPTILLGISWGGILACCLAQQYPSLLAGISLICPGLFSSKATTTVQKTLLNLASRIGLNSIKVAIPLRDPALFTNSPKAQRYIADDPFALRKITIRFARNNVELLEATLRSPEQIHLPVLLMLAASDPITDNAATRDFVNRIGHSNRTTIEYPDASHTLEFEDDPTRYFDDLTQWCRRICSAERKRRRATVPSIT